MSEPFDQAELLDRVDGDAEFLADTIEILEEDAPPLLDEVGVAATAGDAERVAKAAHTLKGMLSNFCAEPARMAAERLEQMGRDGSIDGAQPALESLRSETDRLRSSLREFLGSLES
jgi:HPt (histidine-containing phosphotransfer) domain-containing protein